MFFFSKELLLELHSPCINSDLAVWDFSLIFFAWFHIVCARYTLSISFDFGTEVYPWFRTSSYASKRSISLFSTPYDHFHPLPDWNATLSRFFVVGGDEGDCDDDHDHGDDELRVSWPTMISLEVLAKVTASRWDHLFVLIYCCNLWWWRW